MTATICFEPTRAAAVARLADFVPRAGRDYAQGRNSDHGPALRRNVSGLSPYIRHRLLTEREVVAATLAAHRLPDAEKFIHEVLWRTYWKGWLEMRPAVWARYTAERDAMRAGFRGTRDLQNAEAGITGIAGFDDWARELVATGYLHNHARMWFASIWIFTLRLPWTLGADFFMQHLIDADPASNTLSWRWVAGLQTVGKTYLATADNIARHTGGRFLPKGLATSATALIEPPIPAPSPLPLLPEPMNDRPALLLATPEDMQPESLFTTGSSIVGSLLLTDAQGGGPLSRAFVAGAMADAAGRIATRFNCPVQNLEALDPERLRAAAVDAGVDTIVTAVAPQGPLATALAATTATLAQSGINLTQYQRSWDTHFWPYARKGFFAFKETIPRILAQEGVC